jgi:hypothetical protein
MVTDEKVFVALETGRGALVEEGCIMPFCIPVVHRPIDRDSEDLAAVGDGAITIRAAISTKCSGGWSFC